MPDIYRDEKSPDIFIGALFFHIRNPAIFVKKEHMAQYSREDLFGKLDLLSIDKAGGTVNTIYNGRVICSTNVSERYEIFDIAKYFKEKILEIEACFNIDQCYLSIKGGKQYLELISDEVVIGGERYLKTFHMLNSTDRTRKLSFNTGLYNIDHKYYIISGINNVSLVKSHIKGVTQAAEEASKGIGTETFDEQIAALNSLVGHRVLLSKVREVILGTDEKVPGIAHKKFDAFTKHLLSNSISRYTKEKYTQHRVLRRKSEYIGATIPKEDDFYIDAFDVVMSYLMAFKGQDSHAIKVETDRIMNITLWATRNNALEMLGI